MHHLNRLLRQLYPVMVRFMIQSKCILTGVHVDAGIDTQIYAIRRDCSRNSLLLLVEAALLLVKFLRMQSDQLDKAGCTGELL